MLYLIKNPPHLHRNGLFFGQIQYCYSATIWLYSNNPYLSNQILNGSHVAITVERCMRLQS